MYQSRAHGAVSRAPRSLIPRRPQNGVPSFGMSARIAIVGARGYVGAELIRLVDGHPNLTLIMAASRELAEQAVPTAHPGAPQKLRFVAPDPILVAQSGADVVALCLPNGMSKPFVDAIDNAGHPMVIVDLSADHRFDAAWTYGLVELHRTQLRGATRIANPGCYATAMQLVLAPLIDVLSPPAQCFGVSGYSGAGSAPSDKNDPEKLRDNLIPYGLVDHIHEREVSAHLDFPVEFLPHVAPYFRGIGMTVNAHTEREITISEVRDRYQAAYQAEPLVKLVDAAPWVSQIRGTHGCEIGGITVGSKGRRVVAVATIDNLLKGAASQALININLTLGYDELSGIPGPHVQRQASSS